MARLVKKSKLVKAMTNSHVSKEKYIPTIEETKKWFRVINKEVFNNALDAFEVIEIRRRRGFWAECSHSYVGNKKVTDLSLHNIMNSKKHFLEVLSHEMVHSYQWKYDEFNGSEAHGKKFYKWKPKLAKFKIDLNILPTGEG